VPTSTRGRKAAEPTPEPAEEVEAEVVEDEQPKTAPMPNQQMLEAVKSVIYGRLKAEFGDRFTAIEQALEDATALAVAATKPGESGAGQMMEEDALTDKLDGLIEQQLNTRFGEDELAEGQGTVSDRLNNMSGALFQHQADVNAALKEMAEEFAVKLSAATREGVPVVIDGATSRVPGVYKKVLDLMRRVEEIGKGREFRAEGKGQQPDIKYSFRGIDDAMDAVGSGMRAVGLILRSEVVKAEHDVHPIDRMYNGNKQGTTLWATTRLTMRYTFIDPEDGTEHFVEGYGVGKDNGDKDGSKSASAAMKYALFQGLCIPVKGMNIDPETEHPTDPEPAPQQQRPANPRQQAEREMTQERLPEAQPQQQAPVQRTDDEKAALAIGCLRVARGEVPWKGTNRMTGFQEDIIELVGMAVKAEIMTVEVEGMALGSHLLALKRTLPLRNADGREEQQDG
jgi:hypothetical protein